MKEKHPVVKALARFIFFLGRCILSLRYKVELKGLEKISEKSPVLFMPNHQAVVDPMILVSFLYPHKNIVPVITSSYYDLPVLKKLFQSWGAVRVSDLETGSRNTNVLNEITEQTLKAFEFNRSIVIYPSGQITGQGFEKIMNKKGAYEIAKNISGDVQIMGVRITGLWGSMWSKAWTGKSPDFAKCVLKGFYYVLVNLLFFIPRRKVRIELEDLSRGAKENAECGKNEFNAFLESYYNYNGEEPVKFLKHYFYGPAINRKLPEEIKGSVKYIKANGIRMHADQFPASLKKEVDNIISENLDLPLEKIKIDANLVNDLGADSLSLVEIIDKIEEKFGDKEDADLTAIKCVFDLYLFANGELSTNNIVFPECSFSGQSHFSDLIKILRTEESIQRLFIKRFTTYKDLPFTYDLMLGETTRKNFLLKVFVVAEIMKAKTKGTRVGIMLPALQSTSVLIMATYVAGKVPVMLNWTVGKEILKYCVDTAQVDCIFSASAFMEKIKDQLPEEIIGMVVNLDKEVINARVSLKLKGALKSKFPKIFFKDSDVDDVAVILFTSGSENNPKAVPLTHKNVLATLKGTLEIVDFSKNEILMSVLPPFHSFGFSVMSVLPMVTGVRIVYSPDPTDGKTLAKIIQHTKASLLVTTPGFLNILMNNANGEILSSLHYVVSGAEAITESILKRFHYMVPDATLVEGYGITECSPILSLNPLDKQKIKSVGQIIKGVDCLIADVDSKEVLPIGSEGLICVRGDSIFNGYLDKKLVSPFIQIQNTDYYNTGDLGFLDEEGYLFITGRLKRFIKIAGEMISLPMLENLLLQKYGREDERILAVEGTDKFDSPRIVLFTTQNIELREANDYLRECNAPPIAKLTRVEFVNEIPLLGTGKVDYKVLKKSLEK